MQFLFSLLGHLAPLYDLCAQLVLQGARDVHVYFSVISYGKFRKHSHTTDFANFPHMELMALAPFLVERMRNVGHPYVSEPREQWRRALYSQIRFVHDGHTFGAATTVPPTIAAQDKQRLQSSVPRGLQQGLSMQQESPDRLIYTLHLPYVNPRVTIDQFYDPAKLVTL